MDKENKSERVDELERYYNPVAKYNKWISALFWVGALLSVVVPYSNQIPSIFLQQLSDMIFILVVVVHAVLSHYNGFVLIPLAEEKRRKQLLSDAFNVPLTSEQTRQYYNNELTPSIARLGASILENAFFSKNVCSKMASRQRLKISIYILIWIVAISYRSTDLGLILILTQILFSGEILVRWIKIEVLRYRNNSIYDGLYSLFLHNVSPDQNPGIADILYWFASYESAKTAASIQQSSKIFFQLNPKLSEEWTEIRKKLQI